MGVLLPNWWQELHCDVPVNEECALESGPGEICALAEAENSRHTASESSAKRIARRRAGEERELGLQRSVRSGTRSSVFRCERPRETVLILGCDTSD